MSESKMRHRYMFSFDIARGGGDTANHGVHERWRCLVRRAFDGVAH